MNWHKNINNRTGAFSSSTGVFVEGKKFADYHTKVNLLMASKPLCPQMSKRVQFPSVATVPRSSSAASPKQRDALIDALGDGITVQPVLELHCYTLTSNPLFKDARV